MNIGWVTDPHLDFLSESSVDAFVEGLNRANLDALLLGGDLDIAPHLLETLQKFAQKLSCPFYFVLGNHDYYEGSIRETREAVRTWSRGSEKGTFLPESGAIALPGGVSLIGHGGWGDAFAGDFMGSDVMLNDYRKIAELREAFEEGKASLKEELGRWGEDAARSLVADLVDALKTTDRVVALMHVPPFKEACWYNGFTANDAWAPGFVSHKVGEALCQAMQEHPEKRLLVLCGHTHSEGVADILPNLRVITGGAVYNAPALQDFVLRIDENTTLW